MITATDTGYVKKFLANPNEFPLSQLSHTFGEIGAWLSDNQYVNARATFDLYIRDMPKNRNFLVAAGLEEFLEMIKNFKFSPEDIDLLEKLKLIDDRTKKYLKNFKFTGNVYALKEGTIFFPQEPIMIIEAPLVEAVLLEGYLMTLICSNVPFASKAARLKLSCQNIPVSLGLHRAFSFESAFKAMRAGAFYNLLGRGNPILVKKLYLPGELVDLENFNIVVNAQHLFISSYDTELEAMRSLAKMPLAQNSGVSYMIDTYDLCKGVENAIKISKELKYEDKKLCAVCVDSEPLFENVQYVRKRLDEEGLEDVAIYVATNLDEYKIQKLLSEHPQLRDYKIMFVVITQLLQLPDTSVMEVIYKLSQLDFANKIVYGIKLSNGKEHFPGKKQIFRRYFPDGTMKGDIVGLYGEEIDGERLLIPVIKNGEIIFNFQKLREIRDYSLEQLKKLPSCLGEITEDYKYEVQRSVALKELFEKVKKERLSRN